MMVDRETLIRQHKAEEAARAKLERGDDSGEAATEMFSPEDLAARLAEEDGDATVMMPRTQRRPKRTRED